MESVESQIAEWRAYVARNQVHQQPPHTPLCLSARPTKASHVAAPRGLISYSLMASPPTYAL
jgi:hypothetical protein